MSEEESRCELCQRRYNLFRRKKCCHFCGQYFCSNCAPKTHEEDRCRSCLSCSLIRDQRTTDEDLKSLRTKDLRAYAIHSKILSRNQLGFVREKQELIHWIQQRKRERFFSPLDLLFQSHQINVNRMQTSTTEPVRSNSSNNVRMFETGASSKPRVTLEELSSLESIDDLSVRQLKDILQSNCVSMKGCLEKKELIEKVQLLYQNRTASNSSDENLCKICLDACIDCVLLDCGHLCSCIQCGKQLSECPICRSSIIRLVRVFKS